MTLKHLAGVCIGIFLSAPAFAEAPRTIIVMDGSGSMWGQIDGRTKLEIARETITEVLGTIPADQELGLMAYGHRERGNCSDIELMVPPAAGSGAEISARVNEMRFQ
jgi:Ca-activated chloride channel family protein